MLSRKTKLRLMKVFSFFSVVRLYNIFIIVIAQYLASIYILAPEKRALDVLLDRRLFIIIFCSSLTIASGYIINNFYDEKKDLINRPNKSMLDRLVSQQTQFRVYFFLNFFSVGLVSLVSWRAGLFFSAYIFLLWFYSHKLKRYLFIGNLTAALLIILPFFGIFMYFKNFYTPIFYHGFFLYLVVLMREIVKDLENIKGDMSNGYETIAVVYGEKTTKIIITCLVILTSIPVFFLVEYHYVGYMTIYFYLSSLLMSFFLYKLWKSKTTYDYHNLHISLKLLILLGVFSMILIKPSVLISGKELLKL